ncbi:magnesium transporter CorA family protein, partial [Gottfriedia acidiceleris]|uniref:magnesium transporter CorA family protein n=1 Tax=Gottfriedia acidiceleris TaxID=371036 RepID=UPI0033908A82
LDIHPLAKRKLLHSDHKLRINVFKNEAILSLYALTKLFKPTKINILVCSNLIISYIEDHEIDLFKYVTQEFSQNYIKVDHAGHVLYQIFHEVIEKFLISIDRFANEIEEIERDLFNDPFRKDLDQKIFNWKVQLQDLRQLVEPQVNVIIQIVEADFPFLSQDAGFYFNELKENYERIINALDNFKESMGGIIELQMSLKSDRTNDIMKTLTLISAIFLPMSFIAGFYGMNFVNMPELKWKYGYLYCIVLNILIGVIISIYFNAKGWWGRKHQIK